LQDTEVRYLTFRVA